MVICPFQIDLALMSYALLAGFYELHFRVGFLPSAPLAPNSDHLE